MDAVDLVDEDVTLLAEFNHRLFNTLQLIASQVAYCARAGASASARPNLEALGRRVQALAALHRLLAFPVGYDFEDYCKTLCRLLIAAFGRPKITPLVRMEVSELGRREERYLALLVVELVTNVLKHSLTEDCDGVVWIDLQARRGDFELSVWDSRKAPVRAFAPPRVIEALARALGGHCYVHGRDNYRVVVRFPAPDLYEVLAPHAHGGLTLASTEAAAGF
jgi:two-component sensor histidine kinase